MESKVRHEGVVESVTDECMKVRIVQSSACTGCRISAHCSVSGQKERVVDIYDKASMRGFTVGEEVDVVFSLRSGLHAVTLGFVIPFLVLVATLSVVYAVSENEGFAAIAAICSLIPYYLVLYMVRDRLQDRFSFSIERHDKHS